MKALFLVPQIGFNETELFTIKKFLEKNKIECSVASYSKGKVIGKGGKSLVAKEILCNIKVKDFDCFIVVGGMNVSSLVEHKCVVEMIKEAFSSNKLVVLLCMAPSLFCSVTNIFKGKKVTVFKSKDSWSVKNIVKHGLIHTDEPVVIDGNLLTCRDEKDSLELAKKIVELL
jgi:protein deglycase